MGRNLTNLYISQSFEYLVQLSGSELQNGLGSTLTGSLLITASKADSATSASYALTASYFGGTVTSASYAVSSSYSNTSTSASYANVSTSSSYATNAGNALTANSATSASYAITASYALNAGATVSTASLLTTASATANVITFTKGDGSTFPVTVATGSAVSASYATTASLALNNVLTASSTNATITYTKGDGTTFSNVINNVVNADSASVATTATTANTANSATSASYALTASYAQNANINTGSLLTTASATNNVITFTKGDGSTFPVTVNTGSGATPFPYTGSAQITGSLGVTGSSKLGSTTIETISGQDFVYGNTDFNVGIAGAKQAIRIVGSEILFGQLQTRYDQPAYFNNNVRLGDALTDTHTVTGSLNATGSINVNGLLTVTGSLVTGEPGNSATGTDSAVVGGGSGGNNSVSDVNSVVVGGQINSVSTAHSVVVGGRNGRITAGERNVLLGGFDNLINGGDGTIIAGGGGNTANGGYGGVFGGNNHSATHARSVIIGGQNMSTAATDTVYVPNLVVSGSFTGTVASASYAATASVLLGSVESASYATYAVTSSYANDFTVANTTSINVLVGNVTASLVRNTTDTYTSTPKVQQIVTLTQAEYNAIGTPDSSTLYIISGSTPINTSVFATTGSNTFVGNQIVTGSITATNGFTGSLLGTASYATYAVGAGAANSATTASYAVTADTASYVVTAQTASYVVTAQTASYYNLSSVTQNAVFSGSVRGEVENKTYTSNTASIDLSTGNFFTTTLDDGVANYINFSNILPGQTINLRITNGSAGTGTVSFPSSVKQASGSAYTPTQVANAVDIVTFIAFDSTNLYLSNIKNFI